MYAIRSYYGLRKAWLLFETINSGVNLTINLTGIADDPNCREVVDAYNKVRNNFV